MAGKTADGGLRSYAGMTYAGLKSMIYAGLTPDDPRVKAAYAYIAKHYSVDENPGLGQRGLYYYYQTFAKAMALARETDRSSTATGKEHDWRAELTAALAKRQNANGSWVNPADSFMEGDPNIVTSYGLLALSYARPKAEGSITSSSRQQRHCGRNVEFHVPRRRNTRPTARRARMMRSPGDPRVESASWRGGRASCRNTPRAHRSDRAGVEAIAGPFSSTPGIP